MFSLMLNQNDLRQNLHRINFKKDLLDFKTQYMKIKNMMYDIKQMTLKSKMCKQPSSLMHRSCLMEINPMQWTFYHHFH